MIYTYYCTNKDCKQHDKDVAYKQKITDNKLTQCENCGQNSLEKRIEKSSFVIKGIGVYKNGTY